VTPEQAKAELATLAPKEAEAWKAYKDRRNQRDFDYDTAKAKADRVLADAYPELEKLNDAWYPLHHRLMQLKALLEIE